MNEDKIASIAIVGGGTAGWMTAAALAKVIGTGHCKITLIEADQIAPVGVGEATIPPIASYNDMLGIDAHEMLRETQGTFKLGIEFSHWGKLGDRYMHPFGSFGKSFNKIAFYHYWLKARRLAMATALEPFSLNAAAARAGKFTPAVTLDGSSRSPLVHAYHFDATLYANYLARFSMALGVERLKAKVQKVEQDSDSGYITTLHLDGDRALSADFFFDCTGFRGLLIEETLNTGYENWSHYLPCNKAWAVPTESVNPLLPYTKAIAHGFGWQWRIPLQHRTGNGLVYCDNFISDADAAALLMCNLDGKPLTEPRQLRFTTGRRKQSWNKNCLAVGLSSGFMEPLESTSIHLIQSAISRFLGLFPSKSSMTAQMNRFNQLTEQELLGIRDFLILHYNATARRDTAFWDYCRTMSVPESLPDKLALYRATAGLYRDNNELFSEASWLAVLNGQGISPNAYHPLVDVLTLPDLESSLGAARANIQKAVCAMPDHWEYISRHCQAPSHNSNHSNNR